MSGQTARIGRLPHRLMSGTNLATPSGWPQLLMRGDYLMSLVLAIEPDAGQAGQLAHIVQHLRAELVVVNTTGEVFMALDGRAPDLVLVPALLSPKEEA